jgi:hypothetical protein
LQTIPNASIHEMLLSERQEDNSRNIKCGHKNFEHDAKTAKGKIASAKSSGHENASKPKDAGNKAEIPLQIRWIVSQQMFVNGPPGRKSLLLRISFKSGRRSISLEFHNVNLALNLNLLRPVLQSERIAITINV